MSGLHYIRLRKGLLDVKHRTKLSASIWLYLYIHFHVDVETGIIEEWQDADAAKDLKMSIDTIRKQRRHLEKEGYIKTVRGRYSQEIRVVRYGQSLIQSGKQCTTQIIGGVTTPPIIKESLNNIEGQTPKSKSKTKKKTPSKPQPEAIKIFRQNANAFPAKSWWKDVDEIVGSDPENLQFWGKLVKIWVGKGYNPTNVAGMLDAYKARRLPKVGYTDPDDLSDVSGASKFLEDLKK